MFKTTAALTTNGDAQLLNETVQLSISAANIRYVDVIAGLHGCLCTFEPDIYGLPCSILDFLEANRPSRLGAVAPKQIAWFMSDCALSLAAHLDFP